MKAGETIEGWTVLTVEPFPGGKGPEYGTPLRLGRSCRWCSKPVECDAPKPPGPPSRPITHDGMCAACRRRPEPGMTSDEKQRMWDRIRAKAAATREAMGYQPAYAVGDRYKCKTSGWRYIVVAVESYNSNEDGKPRHVYTIEGRCKTCGDDFLQKRGYGALSLTANCEKHRKPQARAAYRAANRLTRRKAST